MASPSSEPEQVGSLKRLHVVGDVSKSERQTPSSISLIASKTCGNRQRQRIGLRPLPGMISTVTTTTLTLTRIRLNMVEYIFYLINKVKYSILHIENQDMHIRGTILVTNAFDSAFQLTRSLPLSAP